MMNIQHALHTMQYTYHGNPVHSFSSRIVFPLSTLYDVGVLFRFLALGRCWHVQKESMWR